MKSLLVITAMLATTILCVTAQAQDYAALDEEAAPATMSTSVTCQKDSLTRMVEVTYAGTQGEPPCEVHYKKTTEQPGHDQVLWDAQHAKNYCEPRMQEFVGKLKEMGWNCQ